MSYTPLVHSFSHQRNPLCRSYEIDRLLLRCYRSEILPAREEFARFQPHEVFGELYISERSWVDRVDPPEVPHTHERHLDRLFWDETLPRRPICVLGAVGSGKSTLIEYYLRCHCPSVGNKSAEFDKKLIVVFDCKMILDNTDFYHEFFLMMQSVIRFRCTDRQFDIDRAIKGRPTQPQNVRQWVRAALEELTRRPEKPEDQAKLPFKYTVLVIDNLDQTPVEVQIRAITEIEQWLLAPTIRLYRVFLPMWPSTFKRLQNHQFNMLRGAETFEIGTIDAQKLIASRERAVTAHLAQAGNQAGREYIQGVTALAHERLIPRIHALAHGNLRQVLKLWEGFLCSDLTYTVWRQSQAARDTRRSFEYELLDALITGTNDALDHSEHRVANLFAMGHAQVQPRDLLIGPQALYLLAQNRQTQEDLHQSLTSLGYSDTNIKFVEKSMLAFNFFHQIPGGDGGIDYEIHHDVINEYLKLIAETAYIDNIAMVTPVDLKYLSRMTRTRADRTDHFTLRVRTTLAFLEFLRECEDRFRSVSALKWTTPEVFAAALGTLKVPCFWKKMAVRYQDRLRGLRASGYLKEIDAGWWDATLSSALLEEAEREEDSLSPRA